MTSKNFSTSNSLVDRYASALYDLSVEYNCTDKIINDLNKIKIYEKQNKDFSMLLNNPLISNTDKLSVLTKILKNNNANNLLYNFIKIISKNHRFTSLINIINQFEKINAEKRGNIIANITTAEQLSKLQKNSIQKNLFTTLGNKLTINYAIDKSILGGLIIKVGSKMFDSSILTKINKIKLAIKEIQ